jgi:hypothetical protein
LFGYIEREIFDNVENIKTGVEQLLYGISSEKGNSYVILNK